MGTFSKLGKDKAAKERDGVHLSSAVPKIEWASNPDLHLLSLQLLGYGKPLPLPSYVHIL